MKTYDEAITAIEGVLKVEGVRDDPGLRRALALFILDALDYPRSAPSEGDG